MREEAGLGDAELGGGCGGSNLGEIRGGRVLFLLIHGGIHPGERGTKH